MTSLLASLQADIERFWRANDTHSLRTVIAPSWVNSPRMRGTSNILWSCTVTLIACVYTALHLNVPSARGPWATLVKKAQWVAGSLLAPELVLTMAVGQFRDAWELRKRLSKIISDGRETDEAGYPEPGTYDLQFCFWVVMGGLRIDITPFIDEKMTKLFRKRGFGVEDITLTSSGVIALAEMGYFVPVKTDIEDRSKANVFQKTLVMFQVLWMVLQCVVRAANGLPITLLEIHILVHALCALVMYLCWLKKPLDIGSSETLDCVALDIVEPVALMASEGLIGFRLAKDHASRFIIPCEKLGIVFYESYADMVARPPTPTDGDYNNMTRVEYINTASRPDPQAPVIIEPGSALMSGVGLLYAYEDGRTQPPPTSLAPDDIFRLEAVARLFREKKNKAFDTESLARCKAVRYDEILAPRFAKVPDLKKLLRTSFEIKKNFPDRYLDQTHNGNLTSRSRDFEHRLAYRGIYLFHALGHHGNDSMLYASALSVVYGLVHAAAWKYPFPSVPEKYLWRTACLVVASFAPTCVCVALFFKRSGAFFDRHKKGFAKAMKVLEAWGYVFWAAYIVSRVVLVVESFISLRHTPIGAFWIPEWLQMVPHL